MKLCLFFISITFCHVNVITELTHFPDEKVSLRLEFGRSPTEVLSFDNSLPLFEAAFKLSSLDLPSPFPSLFSHKPI